MKPFQSTINNRIYAKQIIGFLFMVALVYLQNIQAAPSGNPDSALEPNHLLDKSWTFSSYFENDLFADTDQNYTNGAKLTWISPDLTRFRDNGKLPDWSMPWINRLPFIHEPDMQRNVAISIGQNMYTPEDIAATELIKEDRPYAGWLYLGVAFQSKNTHRLDSMEVQMGIVGPASLAEDAQKFIHGIRNLQRPMGWHHQLRNEPGLALVYERKWRWVKAPLEGGWGMDIITHAGATVGNVYTYANTGLQVRAGWNIPADFGTSYIKPAGDTNAPISENDLRLQKGWPWGCHLFAGTDVRLVGRDIFLDGNTFNDSHSIDKKDVVADAAAGISIVIKNFKLTYAQIFRTREFHAQRDDHTFGSLTLSFSR